MKVAGKGQDPAVTDLPLAALHPSLFQRLLSEFLIFLELPPSSPSGCLSFPACPAQSSVFSQAFLGHPSDHWGRWQWHPRVCCACGKAVSEGLRCGALGILPSLSPSLPSPPPQEEARALRLLPTEFQPRGGALRPAAPGGEPCLGRWRAKPAQPQGGTRGGRAGPVPTPGLPVPSKRWLPPREGPGQSSLNPPAARGPAGAPRRRVWGAHLQSLPSVLLSSALCRCGYWSASFLRAACAHTMKAFMGRLTCGLLLLAPLTRTGMGTSVQS